MLKMKISVCINRCIYIKNVKLYPHKGKYLGYKITNAFNLDELEMYMLIATVQVLNLPYFSSVSETLP